LCCAEARTLDVQRSRHCLPVRPGTLCVKNAMRQAEKRGQPKPKQPSQLVRSTGTSTKQTRCGRLPSRREQRAAARGGVLWQR
jgi:hypothetical protein